MHRARVSKQSIHIHTHITGIIMMMTSSSSSSTDTLTTMNSSTHQRSRMTMMMIDTYSDVIDDSGPPSNATTENSSSKSTTTKDVLFRHAGSWSRWSMLWEITDEQSCAYSSSSSSSTCSRTRWWWWKKYHTTWLLLVASFLAGMAVQHNREAVWMPMETRTVKQPPQHQLIHNHKRNHHPNNIPTTTTTTVYGHVHMAKTGGTTLNGKLALKYERVCGHKGYSYDAVAHNQRLEEFQTTFNKQGAGLYTLQDSVTQIKPHYNRGRVPPKLMLEIGFQDCDWISLEDPGWKAWTHHVVPHLLDTTTTTTTTRLELHVPCREPLDHLLSMCHYRRRTFRCDVPFAHDNNQQHQLHRKQLQSSSTSSSSSPKPKPTKTKTTIISVTPKQQPPKTMEEQIDACMTGIWRFHHDLANVADELKCFDYHRQDHYLEYMDQRLQPRRQQSEYVWRASDRPRKAKTECTTRTTPAWRQQVTQYLVQTYHYYQFCQECQGTKQDLFHHGHDDDDDDNNGRG